MYQLAPKAGLHQSALGLIESGKRNPTLATLLRVAESLGIELGEVLAEAAREVRSGRGSKVDKRNTAREQRAE